MIPFLLATTIPFTSLQFCSELEYELFTAVQSEVITQSEANTITEKCIETYSKGRQLSFCEAHNPEPYTKRTK